jgi:dCMP deaminase
MEPTIIKLDAISYGPEERWDHAFMAMAQEAAMLSKDPSTQVGAVIVDQEHGFVSMGFNGFARGMDDHPTLYLNRETKLDRIVHAEINAILFAERSRLEGSTLYTIPFLPCHRCAVLVIQAGIKKVVSYQDYTERWQESFNKTLSYFKEAGVEVVLYERAE